MLPEKEASLVPKLNDRVMVWNSCNISGIAVSSLLNEGGQVVCKTAFRTKSFLNYESRGYVHRHFHSPLGEHPYVSHIYMYVGSKVTFSGSCRTTLLKLFPSASINPVSISSQGIDGCILFPIQTFRSQLKIENYLPLPPQLQVPVSLLSPCGCSLSC